MTIKDIKFSESKTENKITQKSFVEKLLQSLKRENVQW